jgi:hypothetical protein
MRIVALSLTILAGLAWVDDTFYAGNYSRHTGMMVGHIIHTYR